MNACNKIITKKNIMSRERGGQDRSTNSAALASPRLSTTSEDGRRIVLPIREDFERLKEKFIEQLREKTVRIETLTSEVAQTWGIINSLETKADGAETYEGRDTLVFSGQVIPPAEPDASCTMVVCDLIKTRPKTKINSNDISTTYRIKKKRLIKRQIGETSLSNYVSEI